MNPLYLLVALQLIDLVSTVIALRIPGMTERNQVLKPLFDKFGVLPVLLVAKAAAIGIFIRYALDVDARLIWLICAAYTWLAYNNISLILQRKK